MIPCKLFFYQLPRQCNFCPGSLSFALYHGIVLADRECPEPGQSREFVMDRLNDPGPVCPAGGLADPHPGAGRQYG